MAPYEKRILDVLKIGGANAEKKVRCKGRDGMRRVVASAAEASEAQ